MKTKVVFLGLRGVPHVQGGVETHVCCLAQELVSMGVDVTVITRRRYMGHVKSDTWNGIRLIRTWAPKSMYFEAIIHSFLGVFIAARLKPDIVHIHAIGPALVTPLARLMGLRVVVTHHGMDYMREKWGWFARAVLRLGEIVSMKCADGRIAVSKSIANSVEARLSASCAVIPNGVYLPSPVSAGDVLSAYGLVPRRYVLQVSRLVPEKRHVDLIDAFLAAQLTGWKLVLVGSDDLNSRYSADLRKRVAGHPDIVMTGFLTGHALSAVYDNAGLFVLPSTHEGFPISLLEVLSHGVPSIASDIVANVEVGMGGEHYYPAQDVPALTEKLRRFAPFADSDAIHEEALQIVAGRYAWPVIAKQTLQYYDSCAKVAIRQT